MATKIKNLPKYEKYFFQNGNIFGFSERGLEQFEIEDEQGEKVKPKNMFSVNGIIYIERIEIEPIDLKEIDKNTEYEEHQYIYSQDKNGKIKEESKSPKEPIMKHSLYKSRNFKVIKEERGELGMCSRIINKYNKNKCATFKMISGIYENENGLYFNVVDSKIISRQEGLYFFPKDKPCVTIIKEKNGKIL